MCANRLVIFDDGRASFGPLTDLRPIFTQRTGALTTLERLILRLGASENFSSVAALCVPEPLADVTRQRYPQTPINPQADDWPDGASFLCVNGRYLGVAHREQVVALAPGNALVQADGQLVAIHLSAGQTSQWEALAAQSFTESPANFTVHRLADCVLIERPWHILNQLETTLVDDLVNTTTPLAVDLPRGVDVSHDGTPHAVHIAESAIVAPLVCIDSSHGPVVIDEHARIKPGCYLEGPCYIGPSTVLGAHTAIRACTSLGPVCNVGGEVSASIVQGYTNKAHLGYLGDSLVGEWCNLGANTNVSNLKNTYGSVQVALDPLIDPPHPPTREDTGRTKMGPILGDYVRTGIGTHILTGGVIHSGCMVAGLPFAPKYTRRFGFYTSETEMLHRFDDLLTTLRRMHGKRNCELASATESRLRELYDQVALPHT